MSSKPVQRITLFKIPSTEDQEKLLNIYRKMPRTAVKAGQAFDDFRNQGYTVAVVSVFKSVEDMKYYDDECPAHQALKKVAKSVHQGAMMVFYQDVVGQDV
jgi:hypothetical protein